MALVNVVAGGVQYATDMNNALSKRMGSTKTVADSAAITTTETTIATLVVPNLSAGFTYAVKWTGRISGSVATDIALVFIRPTSLATAALSVSPIYMGGTSTEGVSVDVYGEFTAATSGSQTFIASLVRTVGSGNVFARAGSLAPHFLLCDYLGF
jgi:hypothetical protein